MSWREWTMVVEGVRTDLDGVQWLFNNHPSSGHDIVGFGLPPIEYAVKPGDVIHYETEQDGPAYVTINGGPKIEIHPYIKAPENGLPVVGEAFGLPPEKGGTAG